MTIVDRSLSAGGEGDRGDDGDGGDARDPFDGGEDDDYRDNNGGADDSVRDIGGRPAVTLEATAIARAIATNPKNLMYFAYAKKRWPKWGREADFSDYANDCIEYFMHKHHIFIKVGEERVI